MDLPVARETLDRGAAALPASTACRTTEFRTTDCLTTACRTTVVVPGALLCLAGRLDVSVAADVRLALVDALDGGEGDLVLDLGGLDALDATGLGVLVGAHRRAQRAGRTLVLHDVTPAVARLLFLTRLDKVLHTTRAPVPA